MGPDQKQEIASYILPEVMVTDLGIVGRGEGNKRYQSTKLATCARFIYYIYFSLNFEKKKFRV